MEPSTIAQKDQETNEFPPVPEQGDITRGANGKVVYSESFAGKVKTWMEKNVEYGSETRQRRFAINRLSDFYRASRQWVKKQRSTRSNITRYTDMTFRKDDPEAVPMPVMNLIEGDIRNEASRLSRPDYSPYVPVSGVNPDVNTREGASLAVQALENGLRESNWPWQLCLGTNHMPQYGGWWLKSYWDASYEKTVRIGVTTAVRCETCGFTLASPQINVAQATQLGGAAAGLTLQAGDKDVNVDTCPMCTLSVPPDVPDELEGPGPETDTDMPGMPGMGGGSPVGGPMMSPAAAMPMAAAPKLTPFGVSAEEATLRDSLDRPLGKDVPLGAWKCETRFDYDMWVEHDGQNVRPGSWEEITEVHVVNLEWLRNRYDLAFDVKPEAEEALQKYHPFGASMGAALGTGKPKRRVRLWEFYKKPWRTKDPITGEMKLNRGLMIHMAHGKILYYGDYVEEDPYSGELDFKVVYTYIQNEIRDGGMTLHGVSMFEGLYRAQDSVNMIYSMLEDTLARMGIPSWLVPVGMTFAWKAAGRSGRMIRFEPDDRFTDYPKEIGNTTLNPAVFQHLESIQQYMENHSMARDVEKGGVPPGVTAAQAIQLTAEQAGQQRAQRIIRINLGLEEVWGHGLRLMARKVKEPRQLWKEDNPGQFQQRVWQGEDLHGQTRVKVDANPNNNSDVLQFANIEQCVKLGTLDPKNPKVARIINRRASIPNEIIQQESLQSDMAEREFHDFLKLDKEPWCDSELDNDAEHMDRHGIDMESEPWRDLEEKAGMHYIWPYLEGWNDKQAPPPMPPQDPRLPPIPPPPSFTPFEGAQQVMGLKQQTPSVELQIFLFWKLILQKRAGMQELPKLLAKALRFRAHRAAHRIKAEKAAQQATSGVATAAAPEAPQTLSGMMPGAGANAGPIDPTSMPSAAA